MKQKTNEISQNNKTVLYVSIFVGVCLFILFLDSIFTFIIQNHWILSSIVGAVWLIQGIRTSNWIKGVQLGLLTTFCLVIFFAIKLSHMPHFLAKKKYSTYHSTGFGDEIWFNLETKSDNTFEIEMSTPKTGYWGTKQKGKISKLQKQRYTDNGKEYYCFYLENFPYVGERSMVSFDDAGSSVSLKMDGKLYILDDGKDENPWR